MAAGASQGDRALAWLTQQVQAGHGGKVLLAGFDANGPVAAWAAGLAGERDYPNFVTFARFALQKLTGCDSYWLLLPVAFEDCLGYRMELHAAGRIGYAQARWPERRHWTLQEIASGPLLEPLLKPVANLPGIMRRDLTHLAGKLEIEPPAFQSGAGK